MKTEYKITTIGTPSIGNLSDRVAKRFSGELRLPSALSFIYTVDCV